jgi:hypothetical protein
MAVLVGALAAVAVIAVQMVSAAPTPKSGTSYAATGTGTPYVNPVTIASVTVPAGRYHVTGTVSVHSGAIPSAAADPQFTHLACDLKSGTATLGTAESSMELGGYSSLALDGVIDASSAGAAGVAIYVSCRDDLPSSASATVVADSVVSIVSQP